MMRYRRKVNTSTRRSGSPSPERSGAQDGVAVPFGCMPGVHGRPWSAFLLVGLAFIQVSLDFSASTVDDSNMFLPSSNYFHISSIFLPSMIVEYLNLALDGSIAFQEAKTRENFHLFRYDIFRRREPHRQDWKTAGIPVKMEAVQQNCSAQDPGTSTLCNETGMSIRCDSGEVVESVECCGLSVVVMDMGAPIDTPR